ncbi:MAG: hypothetical protein FD129_3276, partial [bacterium]
KVAMARYAESTALQEEIWTEAVAAAQRADAASGTPMIMLQSLNAMFDIATTRLAATRNHPPLAIFVVLFGIGLVGAFLVGFNTSIDTTGSRFHSIIFALVMSFIIMVIIDLEFPRQGLIQVTDSDRLMVELRQGMN